MGGWGYVWERACWQPSTSPFPSLRRLTDGELLEVAHDRRLVRAPGARDDDGELRADPAVDVVLKRVSENLQVSRGGREASEVGSGGCSQASVGEWSSAGRKDKGSATPRLTWGTLF